MVYRQPRGICAPHPFPQEATYKPKASARQRGAQRLPWILRANIRWLSISPDSFLTQVKPAAPTLPSPQSRARTHQLLELSQLERLSFHPLKVKSKPGRNEGDLTQFPLTSNPACRLRLFSLLRCFQSPRFVASLT